MTESRTGPETLSREILLIVGAMLLYFGVRNLTAGSAAAARANGDRVAELESKLGFAYEHGLQDRVVGNASLVDAANWVYVWGHWPVILTVAAVLFLTRRSDYLLLRNAMFVSGALGFLFFALLPVAPPRLMDLGLVDTVSERSGAYRTLQPPGLTNQFAALPSLHAGWNLLVGIALLWAFRNPIARAFALVSPVAMALAVVVTANHYVIDVWAGWAVALMGLSVALAFTSRVPRGEFDPTRATLGRDGAFLADRPGARSTGAVSHRTPCSEPPPLPCGGGLSPRPRGGRPAAQGRSHRGPPPQATRPTPRPLGQMGAGRGLARATDASAPARGRPR